MQTWDTFTVRSTGYGTLVNFKAHRPFQCLEWLILVFLMFHQNMNAKYRVTRELQSLEYFVL